MNGIKVIFYISEKFSNMFLYPKENMTKIIPLLIALSFIDVVFSGGDTRLIVGFVELVLVAAIFFAVKQDKRPILVFVVSAVVMASFFVFFLMAAFTVGNGWIERFTTAAFIFSFMVVFTLILNYHTKERLDKGNEDKSKIRMEE